MKTWCSKWIGSITRKSCYRSQLFFSLVKLIKPEIKLFFDIGTEQSNQEKERLDNEFNLPIGSVPLYLRQIDEKGTEEDLINISSGKIIKKWSKKKKGKKKLEETLKTY